MEEKEDVIKELTRLLSEALLCADHLYNCWWIDTRPVTAAIRHALLDLALAAGTLPQDARDGIELVQALGLPAPSPAPSKEPDRSPDRSEEVLEDLDQPF